MDKVQLYLENALEIQRIIEERRRAKLAHLRLEELRNAAIEFAVKELLDGEYLQVVFDAILKSIIKKVEREFYPIEGR